MCNLPTVFARSSTFQNVVIIGLAQTLITTLTAKLLPVHHFHSAATAYHMLPAT
jgi:hypothetical protein